MDTLRILAVSGSLRADSYNTALLRATQRVNPGGMSIEIYEDMVGLPMYNEDLDTERPLPAVADLRRRVAEADGLLIATPEHNTSIPAALKSAIDWLSTPPSGFVLADKPVAIMGASPGAFGSARAQLSLRQILASLGSDMVLRPEVTVFRAHERFDADGSLTDEFTLSLIKDLLVALEKRIRRS
ncbi:NAD(P)H-dependent FMN reductase [Streptoalloteichus tenebrarius]|uniref:NAD(P)H-dependent FMN reductase n=2 Tax=Streptoalloteichus tenebrarius (strain ATCC 17920 / DSM 40477 / JCM 4838 / CBS 697.72 / NBRC 16177 / NCIMB 11028 / NRRL B-12390 / A12253. 1 / ISP 5477) TaxID=1933 RepID=A0ABT1HWW1_STRSD|nr:NAD(P)H-dependent FMN reductase [Streptoalloteichus tenebrarius]BFF03901.1 NAD(P)H-dependent FMN reductase [Streptoalloteichus tenebrarius]